MAEVFVVTTGAYSSYGISAVFTDRAAAEACAATYSDGCVESYEIDPGIEEWRAGLQCFYINIIRDGTITYAERSWSTRPASDEYKPAIHWRGRNTGLFTDSPSSATYYIWARDKDHAMKAANEKRAMAIANGQWRDDVTVYGDESVKA